MAPQVSVSLSTLAGTSLGLELDVDASVRQGKEAASQELGRPADLQRWVVDGAALDDQDLLSDVLQSNPTVFCIFLPRTFDVLVTVITWSRGEEAEYAKDVRVAVSPGLTIEAVKDEIASKCGFAKGSNTRAARLIKRGLNMDNEKTVEQYHLDPNMKLHFVVPRGSMPSSGDDLPSAGVVCLPEDDQIVKPFNGYLNFPKCEDACTEKVCSENDKIDAEGAKKSPRADDSAELLRTMGRYPLRARSRRGRAASTPPERASRADEVSAGTPEKKSIDSASVQPGRSQMSEGAQGSAAAVTSSFVHLRDVAQAQVRKAASPRGMKLSRPDHLRIEGFAPANASNVSESPCGRPGRPPRPPTRPSTQRGEAQRPPTQRGEIERPPTQRSEAQRRSIQHGDNERRPSTGSNMMVRSASLSAQIDRWAQMQRC